MTARDDFEIFERAARRLVRDHVRDEGRVPAFAVVVSRGWSPRKFRTQMSLHLLRDHLEAKAQIERMVRDNASKYAAVVKLVRHEEGATLVFAAFDGDRVVKWQSAVTEELGVAGWEPSEFKADYGWAQRLLKETVV